MKDQYQSPLVTRYASYDMSYLFSDQNRYSTYRKLWLELAKGQKKLGLPIQDKQINEMQSHLSDIDFEKISTLEQQLHHDVMAHIYAFGEVAPSAKKIIHLGATSCFVTDNTDLILMKEALYLIISKLLVIIKLLSDFAKKYSNTICLGYTHFQPAQPTTVGKRGCLWLQDLLTDLKGLVLEYNEIPFLGAKGATGSQASFLTLFEHDQTKVQQLDQYLAQAFGFNNVLIISSQTYPRKIDVKILNLLQGIAISCHKLAMDIRLLSHTHEIREKFEKKQVGSSAMPFKKNPIHSERICSLSRYMMSLAQNPSYTASIQWLERSLDDSANRRICIPEAFLTVDGILNTANDLIQSWSVNTDLCREKIKQNLPFLSMESILMKAVKKEKDRQYLHEKLRSYAHQSESFFENIEQDPDFSLSKDEIKEAMSEKSLIGRSHEQVIEFLSKEITPIITQLSQFKSSIPKLKI